MSFFSTLLWIVSCGFCGMYEEDKEELHPLNEPLLSTADARGAAASSSAADLAVGVKRPRKPPNTDNMFGLGERDVNNDYEIGDLLGEGAFGVVRRCRNRITDAEFACKTIYKSQLRRRADVEDIRREVQILMMLSSHPNVAALVGIYEDDKAVHLILELCQGGQLFDAVIALGAGYSERSAARFFRKMVEVVQHCHVLGIAHRDIKPENFLLSVPGPAGEIKAADFGLSQFFRSGRSFHSLVGSAYYVAPEVLTRNYGPKIDIWSLGVCCYIMLTGKVPFFGETEEEIFDMVLHAEVDFSPPTWPSSLSAAAKDIVRKMLQRDPAKRPTAAELLRHRWLCAAAPDTPLGNEVITRMISFAARTRVKRAAMLMATQKMATGSEENFKGSLNAPETPVQRAQSAEAAAAAAAASQSETLGTAGPSLSPKNRGLDSKDIASAAIDDIRDVTEPQPQPDTISRREAIVSADELVAKVVQDLSKVRGGSGMISLQDLQAELSHYGVSKEDYASLLRGMPVEDDGPRAVERLLKTLFAHSTDSLQEAARRRRFVEVTDEVLSGQRTALDEENEDAET